MSQFSPRVMLLAHYSIPVGFLSAFLTSCEHFFAYSSIISPALECARDAVEQGIKKGVIYLLFFFLNYIPLTSRRCLYL